MEYTTLGSTGLTVSQLCLGTDRFGNSYDTDENETDREEAHELLETAFDHGINFFDTANIYGKPRGTSERWLGDWVAEHDREEVVLASKVYFEMGEGPNQSGLGRKHVRAQVEDTLDRLGTDYLDIYYLHRWDDETPIRETLRTLDQLVQDGKVHYLGISTTAAWKLTKALWTSEVEGLQRFDITQPRYNAINHEPIADYLDICADQQLAVCPYSPLEGGFLTGKYERDADPPAGSRATFRDWYAVEEYSDRDWRVLDAVREVADKIDATPAQVSLRWLIESNRFTCVPIIGAGSPEHLVENVGTVEIDLTPEQRARITEARPQAR